MASGERRELGKIRSAQFGKGGYQDAMLGFSIELEGEGWGVGDFQGMWGHKPDKHTKWTVEDQTKSFGEACLWIGDLLVAAKVITLEKLKGVPVEVTFDGNRLKSWRVLKEVL